MFMCLQSKEAIVIVLWTVFIGVAHTTVVEITSIVIGSNPISSMVTYSVCSIYAFLAFVTMLCSLIGFVADASCGRFKVVYCVSVLFSSPF